MKLVNKLLRFGQLLASIALIVGYIFNDYVWDLVVWIGLDVTYDFVVYAYLGIIAFVVILVPIRYVIEKVVESKFLL